MPSIRRCEAGYENRKSGAGLACPDRLALTTVDIPIIGQGRDLWACVSRSEVRHRGGSYRARQRH